MKNTLFVITIILIAFSCGTPKHITNTDKGVAQVGDTITLSSQETEYDIIIIEPGFNAWLNSIAQPEGYYSQQYLENKNLFYVNEWNSRVRQPQRFSPSLYELNIDYQSNIDYGYEVNYKLYNYFVYFQNRYKQNLLGGRIPLN
ncbi:DUF6146 family protein [uncultured Olleya sp.]|uniref:DUF6146 family protein n=1 Tax=uncultured Olleya sp. TaxID=757243 RepID=UPI00259309C2|nr:DUF6146 family protein [uncultured Olleya sp.]